VRGAARQLGGRGGGGGRKMTTAALLSEYRPPTPPPQKSSTRLHNKRIDGASSPPPPCSPPSLSRWRCRSAQFWCQEEKKKKTQPLPSPWQRQEQRWWRRRWWRAASVGVAVVVSGWQRSSSAQPLQQRSPHRRRLTDGTGRMIANKCQHDRWLAPSLLLLLLPPPPLLTMCPFCLTPDTRSSHAFSPDGYCVPFLLTHTLWLAGTQYLSLSLSLSPLLSPHCCG